VADAKSASRVRTNPFSLRDPPPRRDRKGAAGRTKLLSATSNISKDGNGKLHLREDVNFFTEGAERKRSKKRERHRKQKLLSEENVSKDGTNINKSSSPSQGHSVQTTLTPLQQKMRVKLAGSQFRHINEKLYTSHSSEALSLFTDQPSLFHDVLSLLIFLTLVSSRLPASSPIMAN